MEWSGLLPRQVEAADDARHPQAARRRPGRPLHRSARPRRVAGDAALLPRPPASRAPRLTPAPAGEAGPSASPAGRAEPLGPDLSSPLIECPAAIFLRTVAAGCMSDAGILGGDLAGGGGLQRGGATRPSGRRRVRRGTHRHAVAPAEDESMQHRGGLVSMATPGCGSSIASLTHRTAFGPSSPRLRARDVPERGPAPHDFACSRDQLGRVRRRPACPRQPDGVMWTAGARQRISPPLDAPIGSA